MVVRDCEGKRGGLALMWKRHVKVELHNYSRYHIDVKIVEQDGFKWRFTGIYGEPATEKRDKMEAFEDCIPDHADHNLPKPS